MQARRNPIPIRGLRNRSAASVAFIRGPDRRTAQGRTVVHQSLATMLCAVLLCAGAGRPTAGEEVKPRHEFEREIAPLLAKNCLGCHAGTEPAGELNLATRDQLLAGGRSGPAVAPGKPDMSELILRVRQGVMPPMEQGRRLDRRRSGRAGRVDRGRAAWPEGRVLSPYEFTTENARGATGGRCARSARPPVPEMPPGRAVAETNPVDAFVLAQLTRAGLTLSPPADRVTLLRRATFDLIGLPPTPGEIDAFLADTSPDAYERLIDRLLASPHYGERWGRHWLDVVRFAESDGYERNLPRPAPGPIAIT